MGFSGGAKPLQDVQYMYIGETPKEGQARDARSPPSITTSEKMASPTTNQRLLLAGFSLENAAIRWPKASWAARAVHLMERDFASQLQTQHDHPRN